MRKLYTLSFVLLTSFTFGQTFTATYDFSSIPSSATNGLTDPTPPPIVAGLTFSDFTTLNLDTNLNSGAIGRFSYTKQPLGAINGSNIYTDHTGSLDPNTYFSFTITPNPGTAFDLSKITFKSQRSGTGIRTFSVRSSTDNYTSNLQASVTSSSVSVQPGNIFFILSDDNTNTTNISAGNTITLFNTNISTPITFRIYGWNAESTAGTFSVDDVAITGTITTLSVKQNEISGLSIYPNPVPKGILHITSNSNSEKAVTIFDAFGKQVLNTNTSNNAVNVANLKNGVYILKVTEDGKTDTKKLIIE
ncbi:MAG TPA: T9SS type A sorting domain-containing protein [Flavobacterium sp.]